MLGSVVDTLISEAHNINLYLLGSPKPGAEGEEPELTLYRRNPQPPLGETLGKRKRSYFVGYLWAILTTVASTLTGQLMFGHFELANLVMVYLLGVVFIATRFGWGASILASVLAVFSFDYFFVEPLYSFQVSDSQFVVVLVAMLIVAMLISNLMANVRSQSKIAAHRERRASVLYAMSRELAMSQSEYEIVCTAVRHIHFEFGSLNVILLADRHGRIVYPKEKGLQESLHGSDLSVAQWVMDHDEIAGQGTNTLPGAKAIYFPLSCDDKVLGVLAVLPINLRRFFLPEQQKLLDTFIRQIGQAITRVRLAEQAKKAQIQMESERLRNSLLSSISHDLRTPLATIVGCSSALAENDGSLMPEDQVEFSKVIYEEAQRMSSLVNNILDMARLDAGIVKLNKQWHPLEEIIGTALTRLQKRLEGRQLTVKMPPGIPMIYADSSLIEQVLINLLQNALRYTPDASPLDITIEMLPFAVEVVLTDRGPGIPDGKEKQLFEKFYRVRNEAAQSGVGLGLAICRAIVEAHGGTINAKNRPGGGAVFTFMVPVEHQPPMLEQEG